MRVIDVKNKYLYWYLLVFCLLHSACTRDIKGAYAFEAGSSSETQELNMLIGDTIYLDREGLCIGFRADSSFPRKFKYQINDACDSGYFYVNAIDGTPIVIAAKIKRISPKWYTLDMGKRGRFRQFDEAFNHADTLATYELIEAALLGEEDGYRKLHERNPEIAFPYGILMANAYNNPQAAHNVYSALIELCKEAEVQDSLTLALAIHFLERSAQLDSLNYNELGELYFMGQYVNRDTIKARVYLNLATKDQELRDRKWKDWHEWYEWYEPSLEPTQNPMKEADY